MKMQLLAEERIGMQKRAIRVLMVKEKTDQGEFELHPLKMEHHYDL